MADEVKDSEINPLAGVLTPQALYAMRMAQMQQQMAQAGQLGGRDYAARMAGLSMGNSLGQASANAGNDPYMQFAQQNMQRLAANPMPGAQGLPPAVQAPGQAQQQAPAVTPLEQQARVWDARAAQFADQPLVAQSMTDKANMLRKQDADLEKARMEAYQAFHKGNVEQADMNDVKPVLNKDGTMSYASVPKSGGAATAITGVNAPPQVPATSIIQKDRQPFIDQFAKDLSTSSQTLDQSTNNLSMIYDMQDRLKKGLIVGSGSQFRQNIDNALQTAGFTSPDPKLSNTQAFAAEGLRLAMQMRSAGMRVTQQEVKWFQQASAGDLNIPKEGLQAMLDLMERGEQAKFDSYNRKADIVTTMAKTDVAYAPVAVMYPHRNAPKREDREPLPDEAMTAPQPGQAPKPPHVLKARAAADAALAAQRAAAAQQPPQPPSQ